jgi:transcriptional regulator with XRE-family HTH domain
LLVVILLVCRQLGKVGATRELPAGYKRFFRALGHRIRTYRTERQLSQEDMISYGFSVRHWQMIEAGRPTTVFTLLRICDAFGLQPEQLVAGLQRKRGKSDRAKDGGSDGV